MAANFKAFPSKGGGVMWNRAINPGDHKTPTAYTSAKVTVAERYGVVKRIYTPYEGSEPQTDQSEYSLMDQIARPLIRVTDYNAQYLSHPAAGFPGYQDVEDRLVSKAISKALKAKESEFNLGTFLAEADKSVQMIHSAAARIHAFVRASRKGRFGDAYAALGISQPRYRRRGSQANLKLPPNPKRLDENASNYLLETQYGWAPLMRDAKAAAEKIASAVLAKPIATSVRTRSTGEATPFVEVGDGGYGGQRFVRVKTDKVSASLILNYTVSSQTLAIASSLGLTNPMFLAWEVVPLSFVVDWFLPIGNFLEQMSAFHGLAFHSGCISAKRETTESWSYGNSLVPDTLGWAGDHYYTMVATSAGGGGATVDYFGFDRWKLFGFPTPSFPSLDAKVGWKNAAVAAALIRQRV